MTSRSTLLLGAFGVAAIVHLALNFSDAAPWDSISKCVLAPLLVAWVLSVGGPRSVAIALGFCFLGDLFLELEPEPFFLAGMGAFAIAHVFFIRYFLRFGALERVKRNPLVVGVIGMAAVVLIAWVWDGLPVELRVPVLVYALLLSTTAVVALVTNLTSGIGGLAFLVSDAMIAVSIADIVESGGIITKLTIMPLYITAIALLAISTVALEQREANR